MAEPYARRVAILVLTMRFAKSFAVKQSASAQFGDGVVETDATDASSMGRHNTTPIPPYKLTQLAPSFVLRGKMFMIGP